MTDQTTLLAAVHAAANGPTVAISVADSNSQQQETLMADVKTAALSSTAVVTPTTTAELSAAFPELVASIRAEGATAERSRILEIEGLDAMGHSDLISAAKADGKSTAAGTALKINAAEKVAREKRLAGVQGVEEHTGKVTASPSANAGSDKPEATKANTPDGWKAEYAANPKVQTEYVTADDYVAFKTAEAAGKFKIRSNAA